MKDPAKAHKPELPMTGPGHGGRVGTTGSSLLTQYLLKVRSLASVSSSGFFDSGHISDCNVLKFVVACVFCSKVG